MKNNSIICNLVACGKLPHLTLGYKCVNIAEGCKVTTDLYTIVYTPILGCEVPVNLALISLLHLFHIWQMSPLYKAYVRRVSGDCEVS